MVPTLTTHTDTNKYRPVHLIYSLYNEYMHAHTHSLTLTHTHTQTPIQRMSSSKSIKTNEDKTHNILCAKTNRWCVAVGFNRLETMDEWLIDRDRFLWSIGHVLLPDWCREMVWRTMTSLFGEWQPIVSTESVLHHSNMSQESMEAMGKGKPSEWQTGSTGLDAVLSQPRYNHPIGPLKRAWALHLDGQVPPHWEIKVRVSLKTNSVVFMDPQHRRSLSLSFVRSTAIRSVQRLKQSFGVI